MTSILVEMFGKSNNNTLNLFKDPFKKDKIRYINIWLWNDGDINATVKFKNGDTTGEHEIKGTDFADLITKVQNFIDTL